MSIGTANVSFAQRKAVVDAVAGHGHDVAALLQRAGATNQRKQLPPRVGSMVTRRAQRLADVTATALLRALYPLLALPAGVACLGLIVVGKYATAASLQRGLIRRLLALPVADPSAGRTLAHSLVSLPANVASFVLSAYVWLLLPLNLGYPLRGDTTAESLRDAWGGPTLAGAWAVHAVGGVLIFCLAGLPIMNGLAWLQGRLAQGILGVPHQPVPGTGAIRSSPTPGDPPPPEQSLS